MNFTPKSLVAIVTIFAAVSSVSADEYLIDTSGGHASVATKFFHQGISWLTAEFNVFEGSFFYDPDNVEASSIDISIDTTSLDSNHAIRDGHILGVDYLDTENYSLATFVSKGAEGNADGTMTLTGDISLHGITKEIAVEVSMVGKGEVRGTPRLGFEGATTLDLRDFGYSSFGPAHMVHLLVNVEGIQQ